MAPFASHLDELDPTMSLAEEDGRAALGMDYVPDIETGMQLPDISYFKLFKFATSLDYVLMLVGSVSALLHGFSSPVIVLLFGYMNNAYESSVDDPDKAYREVVKIVLIVTYIGVGTMITAGIELVCWMQIGERQATHLKTGYLKALLKQEIEFYDTEAKVGDVVNGISSDIILIHDAVGEKVGTCISNMGIFLGGIGLGIKVSYKMGLLGLTSTPLLLGSAGVFISYYTKYTIQAIGEYKKADLVAEQAISQVRTVYAYVGEYKAIKLLGNMLEGAVKVATKTGLSKGLGLGTMLAVSYLSWALQFWYGGTLVDKGEIKGGTVNSLIFISVLAGKALGESLQMLEHIAKGKAAASKLFSVMEREPKIDSSSLDGKILQKMHGKIELHKVSFCYPSRPEVPIFDNMTLKIPQGKIVALVGSSGSGKSTVISLIQRFYDPDEGQVRIDGRDIKTLQLRWLRQQIGLVSQEPTLLATSIKKNIMLGKSDASHEEVVSAAKVANAHLFICELPEAYNTEVGERGVQLSGGQRQRVAIARAVIRKPAIVLLDEATSALDAESELLVQKALDTVMQGRTTVVVAHRLSTIRNADTIIVFDKGRIVESGTHEQLLVIPDGFYTKLVKTQENGGKQVTTSTRVTDSPVRKRTADEYDEIVKKSPSRFSFDSSFSTFQSPSKYDSDKTIEQCAVGPRYCKRSWLKSLFSGVWASAVVGTLGAVISGILAAVFPLSMANIMVLLLQRRSKEAGKWIIAFVGLAIGTLLSNLVQYFYWHEVGAKVSKKVQESCFEGIMGTEIGWFDFEENSSTAITAKLSSNSTLMRNALSDSWSYLLQNVLGILLALVLAVIYDWRMGLLSLAILPFQVLGSAVTTGYAKDGFAGDVGKFHEKAGRLAGEAVSSIRTVLSYGAADSIVERFQELVNESAGRRLRRAFKMGAFLGVSHGLLYVTNALCMWYGIDIIRRKEASFGALLISFSIVSYTAYNCVELLRLVPDLRRGVAAASALFTLATRPTGIDAAAGGGVSKCLGHVELRDVTFRYPSRPDSLVLDCVSLRVHSGSTLALVGSSGSGKSSILALVLRFYDPLEGGVFLDGRDLRTLSAREVRSHIGFVQQEPVLFDASIRDNIAYGAREGISEQEVVDAAIRANAHDFISALPQGYDTGVGQRGAQLSGGQRQRIAIARAVLNDPRLLLLDEATSALDAESERVVQEAIDRLVGGGTRRSQQRTTIVVAHRLSTIHNADNIIVMDQGRIVEQGRHSRLLERDGPYARLMSLQQR